MLSSDKVARITAAMPFWLTYILPPLVWLGAVAHGASSSTGTSVEEGKRKGVLLIYNQGW